MGKIILVCALNDAHIIGVDGKLPWHLPNELLYFKECTIGRTVVMGSSTLRSLPGCYLPDRRNIVLSSTLESTDRYEVYNNIEDVLKIEDDLYIIGGSKIYEQFLSYADELWLSWVGVDVSMNSSNICYFPFFNVDEFCKYYYRDYGSFVHIRYRRKK